MSNIENRLYTVLFTVDRERHITVDTDSCRDCVEKWCNAVCPAACYRVVGDNLEFNYEGCMECGACRIVCRKGAIRWTYPRGGFGLSYRYG